MIFRYDAFGRRVAKVRRLVVADGRKVPSDTDVGTAYLWDGDHMIAEAPLRLSGAIDWGASVRWHFEEGGHRLLAREGPDGSLWPVVCDALGSPQEMFDEAGALVWAADRHAWGAVRAVRAAPRPRGGLALAEAQPFAPQPNPGLGPERDPLAARLLCPWRFPGQYEDAETGLFYNRHRHYDPLTGQYASPDPIGLDGGDRPQGYVANPTAWTDPLGLAAAANQSKALVPWAPKLPAYDGTTTGFLRTYEGHEYWLKSGNKLSQFKNYQSGGHVENKAAIIINNTKSKGGVLWHNHPKGTCNYCNTQTPTFLTPGTKLDVIPMDNIPSAPRWITTPKTFEGNVNIPKITE